MATSDRKTPKPVPDGFESGPDATLRASAAALDLIDDHVRTVVFVEGTSDEIAVHAAAARLDRELAASGAVVLPIGGAHAVGRIAAELAVPGRALLGLVDAAEAGLFVDALGAASTFVCDPDLEYELVRSLDQSAFEALLEAEHDLRAFRTFGKQPAWRDESFDDQLHRWLRSIRGRSQRYAELAVQAADGDRLPAALRSLIARL